jgi:hypothetical protein
MENLYAILKKHILAAIMASLFLTLCSILPVSAQMSVNKDGSQADPSALLDVKGTDGGLLIPRMTDSEMNLIAGPATGLMVFNTTDNTFYFFNGTLWTKVGGPPEVDGVIGNEVLDATATGGLLRSGAGTLANPFTLGIIWGGNGSATMASRSDHSHANDHIRLHAMTSTADHSASPWTVFYSNGSGAVTELPLGTGGTVLQSNGTAAAPSWGTGYVTGSGTATQVAFWSGTNSLSGNSNLYWDNTNGRLGIGTSSPAARLDVTDVTTSAPQIRLSHNSGSGVGSLTFYSSGTEFANIRKEQGSGEFIMEQLHTGFPIRFKTPGASTHFLFDGGNVGIGVNPPTQKLHVSGNARVTGAYYDSNNSPGTTGQMLISSGTGTMWSTTISTQFGFQEHTITLVNGVNNNVDVGSYSFIRVTGPTANFSISGFTGGFDGKILVVYNPTSSNMSLTDEGLTSDPANRIRTLGGAATSGEGVISLQYSATDQRWIVTNVRN